MKNTWKVAESLLRESSKDVVITFSADELDVLVEVLHQFQDKLKNMSPDGKKIYADMQKKINSRYRESSGTDLDREYA